MNTNCLAGIKCPRCDSQGPFKIVVLAMAIVTDEGVDEMTEPEWDENSPIDCTECCAAGTVKEFSVPS